MKKLIIICFLLSVALSAIGSDKEHLQKLAPSEKEFVDKFVDALTKNNTETMLKLIHPKCIELYKSKNASPELMKLAMRILGDRKKLVFNAAKITKNPYSKDMGIPGLDKFLIYPIEPTHFMLITFQREIRAPRGLVLENGKFYLMIPYKKEGFADFIKHGNKTTKDKKSNKKDTRDAVPSPQI